MRFENKIMVVMLVALMHLLELAGAFSHYCACCKPKIGSSSHVSVMLKSKATNEMDVDTKSVTNGEFDIDSDIDTDSMDANTKSYRPGSLAAATAEQGRVPYGEESRRYRRTEFVYEDWVTHRTTEKVFSNLNGLFYSGIVRQLKEELALVALSAALIIFWNDFILLSDAAGTSDWISILPRLSLPALPFTLCSPALGLLLVFKTNASYARWLEGRNTWAKIISQARNIVRMTTTFVDVSRIDDDGRKSIQDLSNAVWLLCRSLMNDLSGPEDEECFRREVTKIYMNSNPCEGDEKGGDSELVANIMKSSDRTMAALAQSSRALDAVPIDEKRRVEIDKSLVIIGDCIGTCEKIYSSPVPLVCKYTTECIFTNLIDSDSFVLFVLHVHEKSRLYVLL